MRAVGYRQLWRHLAGQCALDEARNPSDCGDATTGEAAIDVAAPTRLLRGGSIPCIQRSHATMIDALSEGGFPVSAGVTPQDVLC